MMALEPDRDARLSRIAREIRRHILKMINRAGSGHPGGSLSCADIITALYFETMKLDPENPRWAERDRFVLSKGHACPALYAALAVRGFFPVEDLLTLRRVGSHLQGHPDMQKTPGIDASTGSLGQGLALAVGMALSARLDGASWRVYALLGDGELQEGMVWEAAMAASHHRLSGLTAFVDHNGLQIDGPVTRVMNPEPIAEKWQSFGWNVLEADGHQMGEILDAIEAAREVTDQPSVIIARTVKGRGVSFMENQAGWHGVAPSDEELARALVELGEGD